MPIFNLSCAVTVSAYTEVEADSIEEAIEMAGERDVVLGGISSGNLPEDAWIIDDPDGAPTGIRVDA